MSNEFLSRNNHNNRMSSSTLTSSPHRENGIRFDQPIGHDFASKNILVADLAIRSTAYRHHHPTSNITTKSTTTTAITPTVVAPLLPITPPRDSAGEGGGKAGRRVRFNLDDIQIQTIPAYDSASSISSSSEISYIEEEEEDPTISTTNSSKEQQQVKEQEQEEPIKPSIQPQSPPQPQQQQVRISKKASYDALQKRKQFRRDHLQIMNKPGYWYPLAASSSPRSISTNKQPSIRSLEMTEKLINESIQRELKLNPNLQYKPPSPSPSPQSDIDEEQKESVVKPVKKEEEDQRLISVLILDTDEEEEYDDEPMTATTTNTAATTATYDIEEEQESITTATDFPSSIYNELAKRNSQEEKIISVQEYQPSNPTFPFELTTAAAAATATTAPNNDLIISPPPSPPLILDDDSSSVVWIDHTSLLINKQDSTTASARRGVFFVKVLKAESLDFPIDQTNIFCSIQYKGFTTKSNKQIMSHTMQIKHEMRIDDVDPDEQITISIRVDNNKSSNTSTNWLNRRLISRSNSDLDRYIHEKNGSICRTSFSPSRFITDRLSPQDQSATLMLVNNWYKPIHESSKKFISIKKRQPQPQQQSTVIREKAVGKIYIQCLYVTAQGNKSLSKTMDEAIEALNAKRFHQTIWQSGYLYQSGGNTKSLKRRYFALTGGNLIAYPNNLLQQDRSLYKIPLSRATQLICDSSSSHQSSIASSSNKNSSATLLNLLDSVIYQQTQLEKDDEEEVPEPSTNRFGLVFDNGERIQFSCESIEELNKWIAVLQVMICKKLPTLPEWVVIS